MPADVLKSADAINRHLGVRLRQLRKQHGFSLQSLGDIIGASYQQIQKYETGANRISTATLVRLAPSLGMAPASFYEGLDPILSSFSDPDAFARSYECKYRFPDHQLTRSISRLSPQTRSTLNELLLAIEQSRTR